MFVSLKLDTPISDHLPVFLLSQSCVPWFDSMLFALDKCNALSADELSTLFDSTCTNILNYVAPFKTVHSKPLSEPWLNDTTRALRRACRQAER